METLPYSIKGIIEFNYINKRPRINREQISLWLNHVAKTEKKEIGQISYAFCSDQHLLSVNLEYLNHDYYTDIITFDLSEAGSAIEGDIYISVDRVINNAKTLNTNKDEELLRVMVHGLLHLMGYKDKTKKQIVEMRTKEALYLHLYKTMFHVK
ncbi:MAG: rRNA maturation RNase YbeY [Bacteroidetes bacterium B1(2017)]|nr:MAG: rRNA maturation RNase YbeY [Bacteroidetes bacterium B1(2017)]